MMNRYLQGVMLIIVSAACFGFMPIFAVQAYKGGATVMTFLLLRFSLAALLLFSYIFVKVKKISVKPKQYLFLFLLGGVLYFLQATFYFSSVSYIPASLTALILYVYPVIVAILSFFIDKEILSKKVYVSIAFSLVGLVLVLGASIQNVHPLGILLAFLAAITYSLYIVFGNKVVKQVSPLVATAFIVLFAAISFLLSGWVTDGLRFNLNLQAWINLLGIVLISTVFANVAFFKGLEFIGSTRSAVLSTVEPLVTVLLSTLILYEHMSVFQLIGGLFVISSAILAIFAKNRQKIVKAVS